MRQQPIAALAAELAPVGGQYLFVNKKGFSVGAQTVLAAISNWLLAISRFITGALRSFSIVSLHLPR
jgi:hypothetical protein